MAKQPRQGGVPGAPQLAPFRFKKGQSGNPGGRPPKNLVEQGEGGQLSLSDAVKRYLNRNPRKVDELAQLMVEAALGKIPPEQAKILQMVRSIDVVKAMLDRTDGPVQQKIDHTIRTDRTVILHDGPAVRLDDLEEERKPDALPG
jgi:hypothetical protein